MSAREKVKKIIIFNAEKLGDNEKHDDKLILKICDINHTNFPSALLLTRRDKNAQLVMTLSHIGKSKKTRTKEKQTN